MKYNPYAMLLTTGALMLATVIFTQADPAVSLVKAGFAALDRDFPSFTAQSGSSLQGHVLIADEPPGADVAHHPDTRVAAVGGPIAAGSDDRAFEE
jgi:predicted oxidoreductase (fatty acid repression mutant protein)